MKRAKSSHQEKELPMSLENFIANCMQTTNVKKQEMENEKKDQSAGVEETKEIPKFTTEELQVAIDRLKKGKARDSNGIRAEDIKTCDKETKEMVRQIFNEVLKQKGCTPEAWRRIRTKVIYKKVMWKRLVTLTASRSGRVPALISNFGSSSNVQIARTEMPRVESQNVDSDSGLRESLRYDEAQSNVDSARSFRYRITLHLPTEEVIC